MERSQPQPEENIPKPRTLTWEELATPLVGKFDFSPGRGVAQELLPYGVDPEIDAMEDRLKEIEGACHPPHFSTEE